MDAKLMRGRVDDQTIRDFQYGQPWGLNTHSVAYRTDPREHREFAYAVQRIHAAGGTLARLVDELDRGRPAGDPPIHDQYAKYVADLVEFAARAATTFPGSPIDLQTEIARRRENKAQERIRRKP